MMYSLDIPGSPDLPCHPSPSREDEPSLPSANPVAEVSLPLTVKVPACKALGPSPMVRPSAHCMAFRDCSTKCLSSEFATFWQEVESSDCSVVILQNGVVARELPCHSLILRIRWPYFAAKYQTQNPANSAASKLDNAQTLKGPEATQPAKTGNGIDVETAEVAVRSGGCSIQIRDCGVNSGDRLANMDTVSESCGVVKQEEADSESCCSRPMKRSRSICSCDVEVEARDEHEVALLTLMVHMMYDVSAAHLDRLPCRPGSTKVRAAAELVRLCDRYQASLCCRHLWLVIEPCLDAELSLQDVADLFTCMPELSPANVSLPLTPMQRKLTAALYRLVEDLELFWQSEANRQLFCSLTLRAVSSLALNDRLKVASENTVVAALSAWLCAHAGDRAMLQLAQPLLQAFVRLGQLHPSFSMDLIASNQAFLDRKMLMRALAKREDNAHNVCRYNFPEVADALNLKLREKSPVQALQCTLVITPNDCTAQSEHNVFNGYFWHVSVRRSSSCAAALYVYVAPQLPVELGAAPAEFAQYTVDVRSAAGSVFVEGKWCRGSSRCPLTGIEACQTSSWKAYADAQGQLSLSVTIEMPLLGAI